MRQVQKHWRKDFQIFKLKKFKNSKEIQKTKILRKVHQPTSWAESENFETNFLAYEAKQLDETLQKFLLKICKKDGWECEPNSLRVMLASLDGRLREKDAAFSIAKDIEFSNCRKVPEGKTRLLCQQGFGKRPNAAQAMNWCGPKESFQAILLGHWYRPCGSCSLSTLVWRAVWSTTTCTLKILPSAPTTTVLNSWLMRKPHKNSPRWTSHETKSCSTQDVYYWQTEVLC